LNARGMAGEKTLRLTGKIFGMGLAIMLSLGLFMSHAAAAKSSAVVVVVKLGGPLEDLTLKDIRSIYLGDKLFQGSSKIEPLVNGDDSVAGVFFEKILSKSKAQFKKVWKSKAFVDALVPPTQLPGSEDVLTAVKKGDASIGFVSRDALGPGDRKTIKIIYSSAQ